MVHHPDAESVAGKAVVAVRQWIENTTDATRGQPLAARVLARKIELEDALADVGPHDGLRRALIETALAGIYALMTGDLAHPSRVVAHAMNAWLERNKHIT